jgi:hypothetical protein
MVRAQNAAAVIGKPWDGPDPLGLPLSAAPGGIAHTSPVGKEAIGEVRVWRPPHPAASTRPSFPPLRRGDITQASLLRDGDVIFFRDAREVGTMQAAAAAAATASQSTQPPPKKKARQTMLSFFGRKREPQLKINVAGSG